MRYETIVAGLSIEPMTAEMKPERQAAILQQAFGGKV
jgi:hypothetical protein